MVWNHPKQLAWNFDRLLTIVKRQIQAIGLAWRGLELHDDFLTTLEYSFRRLRLNHRSELEVMIRLAGVASKADGCSCHQGRDLSFFEKFEIRRVPIGTIK